MKTIGSDIAPPSPVVLIVCGGTGRFEPRCWGQRASPARLTDLVPCVPEASTRSLRAIHLARCLEIAENVRSASDSAIALRFVAEAKGTTSRSRSVVRDFEVVLPVHAVVRQLCLPRHRPVPLLEGVGHALRERRLGRCERAGR